MHGWEDKMQGRGESQHRVSATEYRCGRRERGGAVGEPEREGPEHTTEGVLQGRR